MGVILEVRGGAMAGKVIALKTAESVTVGKDAQYLSKLRRLLAKASATDSKLILHTAQKMSRE